eukprot:CAMPEP_0172592634 /NCGR_PEP_ID=MMETSP1068-20121228/11663_1 /TAXON_ID=35684 /ORGANISM="Pseudopedinella elastica, Strain CCMP716" /LENGTH=198 /DNA_ID=CAMNT_0013389727 /DNA_START=80 /DNA_END=673 /DNA_ORIENTATION=-
MRRFGRSSSSRAEEPPELDLSSSNALFDKYADEDDLAWMPMTGYFNFATDLGLDPEKDPKALVLAWKLKSAEKPGEIKREEFLAGMGQMHVDSAASLKSLIPSFDTGFMEHKEFRDFYRFCFKFNREDAQKKTIEKELVVGLLPIVLGARFKYTESFCEFLGQAPVARISADEWNSFLEFSKEFDDKTFDNIEDDGAW